MGLWILLSLLQLAVAQKNPHYVDGHSTMVHLFEWKYDDIATECENFLGPMGYGGVQVSPIQENAIVNVYGPKRHWWERYQPVSYELSTRSGNESDFRAMVRRCNKAGVRIYIDLIINHMAAGNGVVYGTGGSNCDTKHRYYPTVPYNTKNFNPPCAIYDWSSAQEIRDCELLGLPDLDQSQEHVRKKIVDFLNAAIDAGIAGFRVDAAKHMWPKDLNNIYSRLNNLNTDHGFPENARSFIYQEVSESNAGSVPTDYTPMGTVTEFKHGRELAGLFNGENKLKYLWNWGPEWNMLPSEDAFVFVDNHDTQRSFTNEVLTYKHPKAYKMAVAFMLSQTYGHPRVMSSFKFEYYDEGPPINEKGEISSPQKDPDSWVQEHRWRQIYNMVRFRNVVGSKSVSSWWNDNENQIAYCRGDAGFVAFNKASKDMRVFINVCVPPGMYCDVISGDLVDNKCTGKVVYVQENRLAYVELLHNEEDGVLAIHVGAKVDFLWPKGIKYGKVLVVLTDAAAYMLPAMKSLEILYPKLLHLTCFAHGLHRVAEFICTQFPKIPLSPEPVVTRWGTLNAALYCSDRFCNVRSIIYNFDENDSEAIKLAKKIYGDPEIKTDLAFIKSNFSCIIHGIRNFEAQGLPLDRSVEIIELIRESLDLLEDESFLQKMNAVLGRNQGYESIVQIIFDL